MLNLAIVIFTFAISIYFKFPLWLICIQGVLLTIVAFAEYKNAQIESKIKRYMWLLENARKRERLRSLNPYKWGK